MSVFCVLLQVLLTLINKEDWQLDCCFHEASRTLFLDIIPGPQAAYPNADKFTYYGYKFETVCTGKPWWWGVRDGVGVKGGGGHAVLTDNELALRALAPSLV